ncbi:MAG: hypothetical protein AAGF85_00480 [Bacteroidota bacterium]
MKKFLMMICMVLALGATLTSCGDENENSVEDTLLETGGEGQDPKNDNPPPPPAFGD